eukprot:8434710-Lingulodinium_polyedra.AAC.1
MRTPKTRVRMVCARRAFYEPSQQHRSSTQAAPTQHSNQFPSSTPSSTKAAPKQRSSSTHQAAPKQHP